MEVRDGFGGDFERVLALYEAVGWGAYTNDPDALARALTNSTWVATAWDGDTLLGLVRVLSDEVAIAWLQDVLVHPGHQRAGTGRALMAAALTRFDHVRSFALMTDDEPRQQAFYRSIGLAEIREAFDGALHCYFRMLGPDGQPIDPG